ncbi:MAG: hypothetical protein ACYTFW_12530 [Planctomycetota bacterium]
MTLEEVRKEYDVIRQDPFIEKDDQFGSDYERDLYALTAMKVRVTSRPKTDEFFCVPVGFGGFRYTKSGDLYSEVFALFPKVDADGPQIRRVQISKDANPAAFKTLSYNPPHSYTVLLSRFTSGDFRAPDNRSDWNNPTPLVRADGSPLDTLDFVRKITIEDFPSNLAQMKGGYPDVGDWRCVEGIVVRTHAGDRKDGLRYSLMEIGDGTVLEPKKVDDKRFLEPTVTVWLPEELLPNPNDKVRVYGTISMTDTAFSMQAYMVRVVIRGPAQETEN